MLAGVCKYIYYSLGIWFDRYTKFQIYYVIGRFIYIFVVKYNKEQC